MKIEFTDAAEEDLAEAAECYELRVNGLGREFLLEVRRVAAVLLEVPALGEKLDPVHRRMSLRRFPYGLIIRLETDVIRVVAVAHNRRRARYWSLRVQDRPRIDECVDQRPPDRGQCQVILTPAATSLSPPQ